MSDGAFMAAVEQVLQVYPDLSKLQAAVVAADEMDIAHDGRSFARIFGVAHARVLRQCVGRGRGLAEDHQARAKDKAHALCRELVTETKRSIPIARWGDHSGCLRLAPGRRAFRDPREAMPASTGAG